MTKGLLNFEIFVVFPNFLSLFKSILTLKRLGNQFYRIAPPITPVVFPKMCFSGERHFLCEF